MIHQEFQEIYHMIYQEFQIYHVTTWCTIDIIHHGQNMHKTELSTHGRIIFLHWTPESTISFQEFRWS